MESLISDTSLPAEIQALKATADLLASQKLRYPNSYTPPVEERHKRPTLVNVPVCEPPSTSHDDDDAPAPGDQTVALTVKSIKPALTFSLAARPTATIADLKAQLYAAEQGKGAPTPEAQRWILKGKAMGDTKLLKEFAVEDGTVVNLMVTKPTAPAASSAPAPSSTPAAPSLVPAASVPALTLSEPGASTPPAPGTAPPSVPLAADLDALPLSTSTSADGPALAGVSDAFLERVASPELWREVRGVCEAQFKEDGGGAAAATSRGEQEAQQVWEAMFAGCRDWIRPNQKALIREKVGYSAMGGV
ncbi:hypothetical protein Rhopal_002356-T1 [Rhodotorula paludigena]|uniref:Ubiquitin-like domain-containing protein n=1 Tax=Rhodotorula paludigena TaxID=86838 RepID=A0AAV5GAF1_9BASI|nr:hypothetical protein Rhopal_002356-T1 [Rhodotorula paludigena]